MAAYRRHSRRAPVRLRTQSQIRSQSQFISSFRQIHSFKQNLKSRVVAERVHERVDLQTMQIPVAILKGLFKLGKGLVLLPKSAVNAGNAARHYIPRLSDLFESINLYVGL